MASHCLTLQCGCVVYVSCHPTTGVAHTRIIQSRGEACRVRRHEVGLRLFLWELLPESAGVHPHTDVDEPRRRSNSGGFPER